MPTGSVDEMRAANLRQGAVCIKIARRPEVFDQLVATMKSPNALPQHLVHVYKSKSKTYSSNIWDQRQLAWYEMERFGFRFEDSDICCFCPWDLYAVGNGGDNFGGPQRAALAFAGHVPVHYARNVPRDANMRDVSVQTSHLCHQPWCCRPDHLVLEAAWRNKARNFCCGPCKWTDAQGNEIDVCGCMLNFLVAGRFSRADAGPPCLRAYSYVDRSTAPDGHSWCSTIDRIKQRLQTSGFSLPFNWVLEYTGPKRQEEAVVGSTPAAKKQRMEAEMATSPVLAGQPAQAVDGPEQVPEGDQTNLYAYEQQEETFEFDEAEEQ